MASVGVDRAALPIPDPPSRGPDVFDARTADLGHDSASPVSDGCTPEESVLTGAVNCVQLDVEDAAADIDHLISLDERLRVATARQ
jgi:arylsulfatase